MGQTRSMREIAEALVEEYAYKHLDKTDKPVSLEAYTVWQCKTLQNWKFLCSTTLPDGMYYELTYDGDKETWYFDAYKKFENMAIKG